MAPAISLKRILFATDFLESSRLALDYAVAFAAHFHATIVMVHAVELSSAAEEVEAETRTASVSRRMAEQRLDAFANGVRRLNIPVETHVGDGIPAEVVLQACSKYQADMLVLGVHGVHRGIDHLLIGSNTEKLLLAAACPVLTVGAHVLAGIDLELPLGKIIYFSDLSHEAAAAAPYAAFFRHEFKAPVEVCQLLPEGADPNDDSTRQLIHRYCEELNSLLKAANGSDAPSNGSASTTEWCLPSFQLEHGTATAQLIERSTNEHAALIVLGVHTESGLGMHLHTSYAYRLLARATCPILSVKSFGPEQDA